MKQTKALLVVLTVVMVGMVGCSQYHQAGRGLMANLLRRRLFRKLSGWSRRM